MEIDILSEFDRGLVHALHVAPRAPFRLLGEVLGTSDQTVARRYRRLQDSIGLRVVGQLDGARIGSTTWFLRLQCAPDAAAPLARALAARPDTAWVRLTSGGTEINCVVHARDREGGGRLLLERLTGSRRIVGVSAHSILHVFSPIAWPRLTAVLSSSQVSALEAGAGDAGAPLRSVPVDADRPPLHLDEADEALMELLRRDGRAAPARLAAETGRHESTVRRRLAQLLADGVLVFDVDFDERSVGATTNTTLWASVEPALLREAGRTMAAHPEVPFAAATTGSTNLLASVVTDTARGLYEYLTTRVGRIDGVRHVETSPVMSTVKRVGHFRSV